MQLPNLNFFIEKSIQMAWNDTGPASGEYGKMNTPVFTVLEKMGMCCKGITVGVFQYKKPLFVQDIGGQYKVGELSQARVVVGWICKNNIERVGWSLQVFENICPDHSHLFQLHRSAGLLYKSEMGSCHLNSNNRTRSPGSKLIGNTAGAREQIQYIHLFNIVLVDKNIKEVLFCKIGGGPGFEISRWTDPFTPEYSADYTHLLPSERIMKRRIFSLVKCSK